MVSHVGAGVPSEITTLLPQPLVASTLPATDIADRMTQLLSAQKLIIPVKRAPGGAIARSAPPVVSRLLPATACETGVSTRDLLEGYLAKERNRFPSHRVLSFAMQMLFALRNLKQSKIIHTDLKPADIYFDSDSMRMMIIDFGKARTISELGPYLKDQVGQSPLYKSPEAILRPKDYTYDYAIDMWSAGIILAKLATIREEILPDTIPKMKGIPEEQLRLAQIAHVRGMPPEKWLGSSEEAHHCFKKMTDGAYALCLPGVPPLRPTDCLIGCVKKIAQQHWLPTPYGAEGHATALLEEIDHFGDLIDRMTSYENRITPEEAIQHPLFNNYIFWEIAKTEKSNFFRAITIGVEDENQDEVISHIDLEKFPQSHWFLPFKASYGRYAVKYHMRDAKDVCHLNLRFPKKARIIIDGDQIKFMDLAIAGSPLINIPSVSKVSLSSCLVDAAPPSFSSSLGSRSGSTLPSDHPAATATAPPSATPSGSVRKRASGALEADAHRSATDSEDGGGHDVSSAKRSKKDFGKD